MKHKKIAVVLALAATPAMAGFESMMNPMAMMNPAAMMNPMGMMNPMTMAAPAMQMAPNMMSFGHQAPQMMTNPYMGGPFPGASTYGQPGFMGMPMPFQQPAPAAPAFFPFAPQAAPAAPAQAPAMMPFDPMMMMNMFMPMPQSAPPAAK